MSVISHFKHWVNLLVPSPGLSPGFFLVQSAFIIHSSTDKVCLDYIYSCLMSSDHITESDISHISESGVESAIRRSHSDWLCSTLQ